MNIKYKLEYTLEQTDYGFKWGEVLVERVCSQAKNPRFQVLRIHGLDGDCIEIICRPKSTKVEVFPNPEMKKNKLQG